MNSTLRNILAVVAGLIAGGFANMILISLGPRVFPPPAGMDMNDVESIRAHAHLLQPQHFVFPFLAHAANAFVGALAAYTVSASRHAVFAWAMGIVSLCGGIAAAFMIPAPKWFVALDLLVAYLPLAWLAIKVGEKVTAKSPAA
ncbi:MAG: hypothetical protein KF715_09150 [Candidatus Didemnitutus sp.]|nr:hypothetical protein [Candidatus Didemnitutus sp.]